ncbi:VOC family protein [Actinomadura decatromicini]|uniref:VOC family protein n=1 Tax=Actinomadura decatromicini TaxID=2604572 RepID=A0A5D3FDM2_9ACTN|nr:VOC family protein [Actinomadura decatromicini]TYK46219.1 VOC family protein [Actinomadura decatromicini]
MSVPAFNTVTWFQVGTDAPDEARRFYGDMFGWQFAQDEGEDGYDLITYPGAERPSGGIAHSADASENHAIFLVMVEDVDATCARTEKNGGKVAVPATTTPNGLRFAYLDDPSGNRFGVFKPAAS